MRLAATPTSARMPWRMLTAVRDAKIDVGPPTEADPDVTFGKPGLRHVEGCVAADGVQVCSSHPTTGPPPTQTQ